MTGEMSQHEADNAPEWEIHRLIAAEFGGTVHAFDVYQGPYIRLPNHKLWLTFEGAGVSIFDQNSRKAVACVAHDAAVIGAVQRLLNGQGVNVDEPEQEVGDPNEPFTPVLRYCVDGHETEDEESSLLGDGQYPPFYIFDIENQRNLPGTYRTRKDAEFVLSLIEGRN